MPLNSPLSRGRAARARSWFRLCLLAIACLGFCHVSPAEDAPAPAEPDPNVVITTYQEFWKDGVRNKLRPIRMEVLVTYYDPSWRNFWGVVDGVPGFVASRSVFPITYGDRVLIEGHVVPWRGLDGEHLTVTVLERNVPIEVHDIRGRLKDYARFKERVVTFEAIFDEQRVTEDNHLEMELVAEGHRINLFHWSENVRPLDLPEGAIVRLTGVYNSKHDPRTDKVEIDLWVTHEHAIQLVGNTATDARFDRELMAIGDLPRLARSNDRTARIAGFVREYHPGSSITLRDGTGEILVRSLQILPLQIGDMIEAVGDPFTWGSDWLLREAIVRRATPEAIARITAPPEPNAPLRTASQVLELSAEAAAQGKPVRMYGIITWCSANNDQMILRDSSGGVLVDLDGVIDVPPKIHLGLRLTGVTVNGPYAPEIRATEVEFWGGALQPEAQSVTLDQLMTGEYQGRGVEIRGHVKTVTSDPLWTQLTLGTATGEFVVRLDRTEQVDALVGSIVSVRGICQGVANSRRQLVGIEVWTHSPDEIRVEQAAPSDPFSVALRPIDSLRQFNPNARMHRWARVRGVVTHHQPGRLLFLQDGTEGLLILSGQTEPLLPGDVVEATGLPGIQNQRVILREARYRRVGQATPVAPLEVEHPRSIDETLDSRLVRLGGTLINTVTEGDVVTFSIQSEDMVFPALLHFSERSLASASFQAGSLLELTGVYELVRNEGGHADAFRLQLRTPHDVTVLKKPSWWTTGRLVRVSVALLAAIAGVSTWTLALRRRVQRQTEQIRAQLAKEANLEAHNRDIVADASDAIFTTDLSGRITSFNPAGERMTGYSRREALAMNLRDLVVADDAAALSARLDLLSQAEATVVFQSRMRRRDGGEVWVESSLRLRREGGQPSGILAVVRDVSERRRVEEELRRARDAAEANTQAKSAFLANMSHEIRTPMNAVIGMSNLLLDTPLNDEQREYAGTIRNGAESLLTVLNDILDFSRIEAGKLSFETVDFDLAETIDETLEMLAPRAASKQLDLAAFVPPALPRRLRGDPGRLRQVLLNLLGNAVKFTSQGEVVLQVTATAATASQVALRFEVRDTGVGMDEVTIGSLFRPFTQADASMARRFGGTGLGLAISKQIVELQGGEIGVESQPGAGSTFWFTGSFERQAASPAVPTPSISEFQGLRLLVVDACAVHRQLLEQYSTAWGMRCDVVASSDEGIAHAREAAEARDSYDVVLTNCPHSDGDGDERCIVHQLRGEPRLAGTPVIALTSVDRRLSAENNAARTMLVRLTKPLRVPELQAALRRALGLERLPSEPASAPATTPAAAPTTTAEAHLRVLVAEDNVTNQRLIALQLGKLGCTVDIANHGIEVLEALERAEYDVVFMDCQMPEMDGLETTRRIRLSGRYGRVRIVAMTANAMEGDRERCFTAGMDEYLSKPVRPDDLRRVLLRVAQGVAAS